MGNISFGKALVAGRKRVPRPPTGNTAFRTVWFILSVSFLEELKATTFCHTHTSAASRGLIANTKLTKFLIDLTKDPLLRLI